MATAAYVLRGHLKRQPAVQLAERCPVPRNELLLSSGVLSERDSKGGTNYFTTRGIVLPIFVSSSIVVKLNPIKDLHWLNHTLLFLD